MHQAGCQAPAGMHTRRRPPPARAPAARRAARTEARLLRRCAGGGALSLCTGHCARRAPRPRDLHLASASRRLAQRSSVWRVRLTAERGRAGVSAAERCTRPAPPWTFIYLYSINTTVPPLAPCTHTHTNAHGHGHGSVYGEWSRCRVCCAVCACVASSARLTRGGRVACAQLELQHRCTKHSARAQPRRTRATGSRGDLATVVMMCCV